MTISSAEGAYLHPPLGELAELFQGGASRRACLQKHPAWINVLRGEEDHRASRRVHDVLNEGSPFHRTRMASRKLYDAFFEPLIEGLPPDSSVLDAGCGTGRFTLPLAARFTRVTGVDAGPTALKYCLEHLEAAKREDGVRLICADLSVLDEWAEGLFDLVMAVECVGYTDDPGRSVERLARVAKAGAPVCLSVEGPWGSLPADSELTEAQLAQRLDGRWTQNSPRAAVHYFSEEGFAELMKNAGLSRVRVQSSHYLLEGPFWSLVDESRLGEESYWSELLRIEAACREHPVIAPLARVVSGIGYP